MSGPFRFAYNPPTVGYGPGSVAHLDTELARVDCTRPLVVCGQTVGERPAVLDPVRDGLGTRCAGVFPETTPAKRLTTAVACAERIDECNADGIVALGSGSSIDVARAAGAVAASEHSPAAPGDQFAATGTLSVAGAGCLTRHRDSMCPRRQSRLFWRPPGDRPRLCGNHPVVPFQRHGTSLLSVLFQHQI